MLIYYLIIADIVILLAVAAALACRKKPTASAQMLQLSDGEFLRSLLPFAKQLRYCERGNGVNLRSMNRSLERAYKILSQKITAKEPLFSHEKWFFENIYLVRRFIFSGKERILKKLPHVNGEVRTVLLARKIVTGSLKTLDADRISLALKAVKNELSLCYEEISGFSVALGVALTEQAYILAERIIFNARCERAAAQGVVSEKLLKSDTYCHYAFANPDLRETAAEALKKYGINPLNVALNYNNTLMESIDMAETVLGAFRLLSDFIPRSDIPGYVATEETLLKTYGYAEMSLDTKCSYHSVIAEISEKCNVSELMVAARLLMMTGADCDVGTALYDCKGTIIKAIRKNKCLTLKRRGTEGRQRLYTLSALLLSLGVTAALCVLLSPIMVLAFPTAFLCIDCLFTAIGAETVNHRHLPQMNFGTVPPEYRTLVAVPVFIPDLKALRISVERLLVIRDSNAEENVDFALLIDFPSSESRESDRDVPLLAELEKYAEEPNLNFFVRNRVKSGKKYVAFERKRGAVTELNKLLLGKGGDFRFILKKDFLRPSYVMLLDDDSTLLPGTVKETVNVVAHPYNKRYDLIGFHSRYSLFSIKSRYSCRFASNGGFDGYPMFSPYYYDAFGVDVFCGKGIYNLNAFDKKTDGAITPNTVLSHDILEGALVNTGAGGVIFEDAPQSFVAERSRRRRWTRGDLLLLPYVLGRKKSEKIAPIYRYIMAKNLLNPFSYVFLTALGLYGLVSFLPALITAAALLAFPFVINIVKALRSIMSGVRLRYAVGDVLKNVALLVEEILLLPYYAADGLYVILKTAMKKLTKANILEWKTFTQTNGDKGAAATVREFTLTYVLLAFIAAALFFVANTLIFSIYALLCVAYSLIIPVFDVVPHEESLTENEREYLLRAAENTYRYFEYTDIGIGTDNLQVRPYKGMASVTSATDIGFALLAEVCGCYLKFIDGETALNRISAKITEVESLEKYKGNLFNWYDIGTKKPVDGFVSSVDSGNFLACLIVTKNFALDLKKKELANRIDAIIKNTDLRAFFDVRKDLFYLGVKEGVGIGHYDMLVSEARLLSLLYVARDRSTLHWRKLQRDYTSALGNTLMSWSGTAFEYLMSDLFFLAPKKSQLGSSCKNAAVLQLRKKKNGIWGVGESGYYAFDENLKYQYMAFGVERLSLRGSDGRKVVSPYSVMLTTQYNAHKAIKNLRKIDGMGGSAEYGYYEAIDCDRGNKVVAQYMSHHQGMILASVANLLCGGVLRSLLKNDRKTVGAMNVLNETPNHGKIGLNYKKQSTNYSENRTNWYENDAKVEYFERVGALSNGKMTVVASAYGDLTVRCDDIYINPPRAISTDDSPRFFVERNGEVISPSFCLFRQKEEYTFSRSGGELVYRNVNHNLTHSICVSGNVNTVVFKLDCDKGDRISFYFPLSMNTDDGFLSHPQFNGMFVNTFLFEDDSVVAVKRSRKKVGDLFCSMTVRGVKDADYETNRFNYVGRRNSVGEKAFSYSENRKYPSIGDVLEPCFAFSGTAEGSVQVAVTYSESLAELFSIIRAFPVDLYRYAFEPGSFFSPSELTCALMSALTFESFESDNLRSVSEGGYTDLFFVENGRKPLIIYEFDRKCGRELDMFLSSTKELLLLKIPFVFVIIYEELYGNTQRNYLLSLLEKNSPGKGRAVEKKDCSDVLIKSALVVVPSNLKIAVPKKRRDLRLLAAASPLFVRFSDVSAENFDFQTGSGGYKEDKYVVSELPMLPYSNVVCDVFGGFVATDNGGGLIYFGNSRENKVSYTASDPVTDEPCEYVFLHDDGYIRINGGNACRAEYSSGEVSYKAGFNGINTDCRLYLLEKGKIRVTEVDVSVDTFDIIYALQPCLGWKTNDLFVLTYEADGFTCFHNLLNEQRVFLQVLSDNNGEICYHTDGKLPYVSVHGAKRAYFVISPERISLSAKDIERGRREQVARYEALRKITVFSGNKPFDYLVNALPYQIYSSRLAGRCGYYQIGGAVGFRDQLQDVLAFLGVHNEIVSEFLSEAMLHQYEEGDVMHWWHSPKWGLRTKISDDKLYLPYVMAKYVEASGDKGILNKKFRYLKSPILKNSEQSRFENPDYTDYDEDAYGHCVRAIKSAMKFGEHGLLLMGGGDWNDGMDCVGELGRGESVLLSMFFIETVGTFSPYLSESDRELTVAAEKLKNAINTCCYDGNQYARAFTDDGKWLGTAGNSTYEIDLTAESYAVLSGVADAERAKKALKSAEKLIDSELGIIKLLYPPQTKSDYLGYISTYPRGVRENGGQYTHAAIWYLIALARVGQPDKSFELFQMINPAAKCASKSNYMGEPYVLAGDVYANPNNAGRMGWSWYTGSAAYAYRLVTEEYYGLHFKGSKLYIVPNLPKALLGSVLEYKNGDSMFKLSYIEAEEGEKGIFVDNIRVKDYVETSGKRICNIIIKL